MEERPNKGLSRREFLKDAGLIVGGGAIGSMTFLSACGGTTVTETTTAAGSTATTTITAPGITTTLSGTKFIDPYSMKEFSTLEDLKAYLDQTVNGGAANLTTITVNGVAHTLANLDPSWSLMYVLRETLGYVGTKNGCSRGECGTCTVILNGKAVYSCTLLACEADGADIQTIEGMSDKVNFTGIMKAVYDTDPLQCGYCAPGFIMASKALLDANSSPTLDEVREALSGHICTCGNIKLYVDAVLQA